MSPLRHAALALALLIAGPTPGQDTDRFRQLEEILPTPTACRTASGAPGAGYWQQTVDYEIDVALDEDSQRVTGSERIRYVNNSPDGLRYLWLQLDANIFRPDSDAATTRTAPSFEKPSFQDLRRLFARRDFDGGTTITRVAGEAGQPLDHTIVGTMMRIDLPAALGPGGEVVFEIDWHHTINPSELVRGRAGAEFFAGDGNWLFEVAQWFPRLCAYTDTTGWQHKQFLGRGEFTLEFGDYDVRITVPADHVVAATGVLVNPEDVLSVAQRQRLEAARTAPEPIFVVTPEEAAAAAAGRSADRKTWVFRAEDVRDFAFASSRKFIWDALGVPVGDRIVMAMSLYPAEGEPLWSRYSTHAVAHTLEVYGRHTIEYPYPVAISVNGPVGGMEYPMICFNGPRPEKDGTYSRRRKYGLISVIIHEVGHNFFPMIVNSDERQWTWMDEGLNTFVQYLAEQAWEEGYPSWRGEPKDIVAYMKSDDQVPIMTNSESIRQFGNNAYGKPATALNILRETILGRELFDFAFAEYARRWAFKRPMPADFFRTMEDASGVDLDWFWRGWFYSTEPVDLAITGVALHRIDTRDPDVEKPRQREEREAEPATASELANADLARRVERYPALEDFYNGFDELDVTERDRREFKKWYDALDPIEKEILASTVHFYVVEIENVGGLVMPILLELHFDDGSTEEVAIATEIWRGGSDKVSKLVMTDRPIERIVLDPHLETADIDRASNHFPRRVVESRFRLFKDGSRDRNPMQLDQEERERSEAEDGQGGEGEGGR